MSGGKDNVQVVVRCRPLFGKEIAENRERIVEMDLSRGQVSLRDPKGGAERPETKHYTFDKIFDWNCAQKDVYDGAAARIVDASIEGYNGTIFCYGQTGTGKTHTMEGKDDPPSERGILPHAFRHVFDAVADDAGPGVESLVRASFLEIYNENVRDLLAKDQTKTCALKETPEKGVYVDGLTTFVVKSAAEMHNILQVGKKNRSVGATLMNADSSRSHSIFTVTVETSRVRPGDPPGAEPHITVGKLNLVDLAGSERQSKTQASGDRLKEATKINLSLSALGNVISALVDGKSRHIPYRDSKLTRLLQDSLGGNTKTVMIANVGPADYNFDETVSTLRYANRAKNIKNKPKINEDAKDAMLREFQEEIARLKAQLERDPRGGGGDAESSDAASGRRSSRREKTATDLDRASARSDRRLESIREAMRAEMAANALMDLEKEEAEKAQALARERARAQMQEMMEERGRTDEERAELEDVFRAQQAEMEERFAATSAAREEHRVLQERLAAMEAKVVKGGTNLLDQEQRLVEEARIREEKMRKMETYAEEQRRRIEDLENLDSIAGESYASVDEEIESKASKIERLKQAYRRCAADIEDLDDEFVEERDELLEQVRALTRRIKLKNLVLDFCVPPERLAEISERCRWDDGAERWVLEHAAAAGNAARARREEEARERALLETEELLGGGGPKQERREERERPTKALEPLSLTARRLVGAIADVTGDPARAREMAARSQAEKMLAAYLTYDEVKARRNLQSGKNAEFQNAAAEDARGDSALPDGATPSGGARASSRRARPGTARNPRRGRDEGLDALRARESDAARFPVARGLVKPR